MDSFLASCFLFRKCFQANMRAMIYWDDCLHSCSFSGKSSHGNHQNAA